MAKSKSVLVVHYNYICSLPVKGTITSMQILVKERIYLKKDFKRFKYEKIWIRAFMIANILFFSCCKLMTKV